jgi:predicted alpha/beta-fold hydrolase
MGLTNVKFEEEKTTLSTLKVKNNTKFILIGTPEKEIQEVAKTIKNNNVIDDFDEDYFPDAEDVKNAQKYNDKLMKRLDQVNKPQLTVF